MNSLLALLSWLASDKILPKQKVISLYNSIPVNIRNNLQLPKLLGAIKSAMNGEVFKGKLQEWADAYMINGKDLKFGTTDQKGYYDNLRKFFQAQSESAYKKIQKDVGKFTIPEVAELFEVELVDDRDQNIESLAKKLTGKPYVRIPMAVAKNFSDKVKNSKLYLDYKDALKTHTDFWKNWLRKTIRSSGKSTEDAKKIYDKAKARGLKVINIPDNFVGRIDENGKFYTTENEPLFGGSAIGKFILNKSYDPSVEKPVYYGSVVNPDFKSPQKMYTQKSLTGRRTQKEAKVSALVGKIDKIIKKWQKDLLTGKGITKALGAIMEAVWETGGRIGSEMGETKGEKTYGISSLRVGHIKQIGNKLQIKYKGKDGQLQLHILTPSDKKSKALISFIKENMEGKKSNYRLWDTDSYTMSPQKVNLYLKKIGVPKGTTVHKLRHVLAEKIWLEESQDLKLKDPTTKQIEEVQKKIAESVGKQLGHFKNTKDGEHLTQPATSLKNYIPVSLQKQMYDDYQVPYSKRLEQLLKDLK